MYFIVNNMKVKLISTEQRLHKDGTKNPYTHLVQFRNLEMYYKPEQLTQI